MYSGRWRDSATTSNGLVRYEMVSLTGSPKRPELDLFAPPASVQ
jgi:hypothetical protein